MFSVKSENAWGEALRLHVFDLRRGREEGHEADKILYFYPRDVALDQQKLMVGLSEGLLTFTRLFSPDHPCEALYAEKHRHIFYECEPSVWMVLVVKRGSPGGMDPTLRDGALRGILQEAYRIFVLFYGDFEHLLAADTSATLLRQLLDWTLSDHLHNLLGGKRGQHLPSLGSGLSERNCVAHVAVDRSVSLSVQSLVSLVQTAQYQGGTTVDCMLFYQGLAVTSTLQPADSATLQWYIRHYVSAPPRRSSLPAAPPISGAAAGFKSSVRSLFSNVTGGANAAAAQRDAAASHRSASQTSLQGTTDGSRPASPRADGDSVSDAESIPSREGVTAQSEASTSAQVRPLRGVSWWRQSDGWMATDAWRGGAQPSVYSEGGRKRAWLHIYQHKGLMLVLLVPADDMLTRLLPPLLLEKVTAHVASLEPLVANQYGGSNATHVPGYRYLFIDRATGKAQASPHGKVGTLAKESLAALNQVRGEQDEELARAHGSALSGDAAGAEGYLRAQNNAWVVAKRSNGRELYVVLERVSETLVAATDMMQRFNSEVLGGLFQGD